MDININYPLCPFVLAGITLIFINQSVFWTPVSSIREHGVVRSRHLGNSGRTPVNVSASVIECVANCANCLALL